MSSSSKIKKVYVCQNCETEYPKWQGQCRECGEWNGLNEVEVNPVKPKHQSYSGEISKPLHLDDVNVVENTRIKTEISELDYVLGGGLVSDSVVLIGGDPGIGKSTLLLQMMARVSHGSSVLYVSGEESLQQIAMRATRLGVDAKSCQVMVQNQLEAIVEQVKTIKPLVVVIDSIQTVVSADVASGAGSVSQIRYCGERLVQLAKQHGVAIVLVGHVTKEGAIAGPRVLEHMVDCVLYFESQADQRFRAIRAVKNRFGAVGELGIFAMTDQGLKTVKNPSAIFLSHSKTQVAGRVILVSWEGTRPLLIEVQALVDDSVLPQPRRLTVGLDGNRLNMILAIARKHGSFSTYDQDVFVNAVGGVKLVETGADVAVLLAILSSFKNVILPSDTAVFGEIGLTGEIRPVPGGQMRLKEAKHLGFKRVIAPYANVPKQTIQGLEVIGVSTVGELLNQL